MSTGEIIIVWKLNSEIYSKLFKWGRERGNSPPAYRLNQCLRGGGVGRRRRVVATVDFIDRRSGTHLRHCRGCHFCRGCHCFRCCPLCRRRPLSRRCPRWCRCRCCIRFLRWPLPFLVTASSAGLGVTVSFALMTAAGLMHRILDRGNVHNRILVHVQDERVLRACVWCRHLHVHRLNQESGYRLHVTWNEMLEAWENVNKFRGEGALICFRVVHSKLHITFNCTGE